MREDIDRINSKSVTTLAEAIPLDLCALDDQKNFMHESKVAGTLQMDFDCALMSCIIEIVNVLPHALAEEGTKANRPYQTSVDIQTRRCLPGRECEIWVPTNILLGMRSDSHFRDG